MNRTPILSYFSTKETNNISVTNMFRLRLVNNSDMTSDMTSVTYHEHSGGKWRPLAAQPFALVAASTTGLPSAVRPATMWKNTVNGTTWTAWTGNGMGLCKSFTSELVAESCPNVSILKARIAYTNKSQIHNTTHTHIGVVRASCS